MVERRITRLSEAIRRYLPLLLGACYLLAMVVPYPGQLLHGVNLPEQLPDVLRPRMSQLLVALLLFLAALGVELSRIKSVVRQPGLLLASLTAVWLAPAAAVLLAWWVFPWLVETQAASSLLVGFALVAAMPVANSSAAWTQQSRGALPWALALVVVSIVVCPWIIPLMLRLLGLSFSPIESRALEQLTASFTGTKFVVWVLLPTGLGMVARWVVGAAAVAAHRQAVLLLSAIALLTLNYINASVALPQMRDEFRVSWLLVSVATSVVLCVVGLLVSRLLARLFAEPRDAEIALSYSLTMKNTGLALALANDVLADQPKLLLPVFTMTLVQHLFAATLHRWVVAQQPELPGAEALAGESISRKQ